MANRKSIAAADVFSSAQAKQVILEYEGEVFWLRDAQLAEVRRLGFIHGDAAAVGLFNDGSLTELVEKLIEKGHIVAVAEGQNLRTVTMPPKSKIQLKVETRPIGLAPELLMGARELAQWAAKLAARPEDELAVRQLREQFLRDEARPTPSYGPIYVYQLTEAIYEVDWALTATPEQLFRRLLVAAHQSKRLLRCHLVAPKGRRGSGRPPTPRTLSVSEPVTYGQLRLVLQAADELHP